MKRLSILFTLLVAGCGTDWQAPVFDDDAWEAPNITIGELREYLSGAETTLTDDVVLSGWVISSTRAGNFYNTFLIDDGTGAVEIMAGWPDLDAMYHQGQRIVVRGGGLAIGWRDGVMQMGLPPEPGSRYPTGYFYHPAVIRHWVAAERDIGPVTPIETSIGMLDGSLCGRLVRIGGVVADTGEEPREGAPREEITWALREPEPLTGYVKFRASPTDSITVVTSGYASFALAPVPTGRRIALTGILMWGKGGGSKEHYLLKLRDEKDIDF